MRIAREAPRPGLPRGLTQAEAAERLRLTEATYRSYELGNSMLPIDVLRKLPGVLERPVSYFLGLPDEPRISDEGREVLWAFESTRLPNLRKSSRDVVLSNLKLDQSLRQ